MFAHGQDSSSASIEEGLMTSRDLDRFVLCCLFPPTRGRRLRSLTFPFDTDYVKTWHPTRTSWLLFGFYSRHPLCSGMLSIA